MKHYTTVGKPVNANVTSAERMSDTHRDILFCIALFYCDKRFANDPDLAKVPIAAIPTSIRHGIAPAMAATMDTSYLGHERELDRLGYEENPKSGAAQ